MTDPIATEPLPGEPMPPAAEIEEDPDEGVHPDCLRLGHDERTDYEDDEVWQGTCQRCGAELFQDKHEVVPDQKDTF